MQELHPSLRGFHKGRLEREPAIYRLLLDAQRALQRIENIFYLRCSFATASINPALQDVKGVYGIPPFGGPSPAEKSATAATPQQGSTVNGAAKPTSVFRCKVLCDLEDGSLRLENVGKVKKKANKGQSI